MPKDMKSDSPKKSRHSKRKKKNNSSDDDTDEEVVFMEALESEEEEVPKSGTADFAKMFQQLGRKYKAKKDDEEDKNKKKSNKSINKKKKLKKEKLKLTKKGKEKIENAKRKKQVGKKKNKKLKKKVITEDEEEDEDEDEDDEDYVPEEEDWEDVEEEDEELDEEMVEYLEQLEEESEDEKDMHEQAEDILKKQFNIIFTVGGRGGQRMLDDDYEYEYEEEEDEEEVIISSDEEEEKKKVESKKQKKSKKKSSSFKVGDRVKVELKDWDKPYFGKILKIKKKEGKKYYDIQLDEDEDGEEYEPIKNVHEKRVSSIVSENESDDFMNELESLIKAKNKGGNKAVLNKFYEMVDKKEKLDKAKKEKEDEKKKASNLKKFKKLLRGNTALNEYKYFKKLDTTIQKKIMKKLKEVNDYTKVEVPHKLSLIEADIPVRYKSTAMKKLETLQWMDPGSGEYYKIKQWVDTFMKIPFNKYKNLPVSMESGEDKYNEFMEYAKTTLDEAVYGMDDAKMQIMQLVGQWISNPKSIGTAIAIGGPPGTGKTTLLKEGVSKILGRPFSFLALGGATDSSFLEGHSYTYEGSVWGRVVDIIINSKCMNPVIYFDELDKISNTPKGEEIVGILTHLTDTTQNDKFHDKYFSGIDFDLSKVLFIFSYNDETKINPILKDRMYRINTDGYKKSDKCVISQKYLLPKIIQTLNFKEGDIIIPDETIGYISENLVQEEKGVRNLKRALEIIYTKLNLYRLMKKDSKLFEKETTFEVTFPFTVTVDIAKKLVKKDDRNGIPFGMYV